tara:strand:- start:179 stop:493 length:315 start_codon:yes stop_codon:yes gene_type:complete
VISLQTNFLSFLDIALGFALSFLTLAFLIRLIMSWYPKIDTSKGLWFFVLLPTSSILKTTKKLIPPIGGVDITPVIWIGIISLVREILVGQQGLIKLIMQANLN